MLSPEFCRTNAPADEVAVVRGFWPKRSWAPGCLNARFSAPVCLPATPVGRHSVFVPKRFPEVPRVDSVEAGFVYAGQKGDHEA